MKIKLSVISVALLFFYSCKNETANPPYKNASLPVEQRITDLLHRMTVEEKIKTIKKKLL